MRIAGVNTCSMVNGPGVRYVIFTQGCNHHCEGCHNPETWDFEGGMDISVDELINDISKHKHLDGVTLSGGEPFCQQKECVELLKRLPEHLNIWVFTGYEWEDIKDTELVSISDYIVDGRFEYDKKSYGNYKGSENQRIIKVK